MLTKKFELKESQLVQKMKTFRRGIMGREAFLRQNAHNELNQVYLGLFSLVWLGLQKQRKKLQALKKNTIIFLTVFFCNLFEKTLRFFFWSFHD